MLYNVFIYVKGESYYEHIKYHKLQAERFC